MILIFLYDQKIHVIFFAWKFNDFETHTKKDKREKFNDVLDEIVEMHKAVNRYVNENLFFPHQQ